MKWVRRIVRVVVGCILILVIGIGLVLYIDNLQVAYLKPTNIEGYDSNTYLIRNVHIIPMSNDTVLYDHMLYIRDGRIEKIAKKIEVENIEVFDGHGGYILPGLIDMHVHLWDKQELGLYLANGVTAIRNVWGMPFHLRLKSSLKEEIWAAPFFLTSSPKLTGPEFMGDDNLQIFSPGEAAAKVREYQQRGYDFIKTYNGMPQNIFESIRQEALKENIDLIVHPSSKIPYASYFQEPVKTVEHVEDIVQQPLNYRLDTLAMRQVVDSISKSTSTSFCPTAIVFYNIYNMLSDKDMLETEPVMFMNPAIRKIDSEGEMKRWQDALSRDSSTTNRIATQHLFHLFTIRTLHQRNVNIVCGTDAGIGVTVPGFSIHEELQLYQQAGLSNYEVLKTATVNPSKTHKQLNNMGTIEEGKVANFLLLKENPMTDLQTLQSPQSVFINGHCLNKAALSLFVKKARNRKTWLYTLLMYIEFLLTE